MKRMDKSGFAARKPLVISGAQIVFISVIIAVTLLISIWNAGDLQKVLKRSTKDYLKDVTVQMAGEISNTMRHKAEDLAMLADSVGNYIQSPAQAAPSETREPVSWYKDADLKEFLNRKAGILEFNLLLILDRHGQILYSDPPDSFQEESLKELFQLPGIQQSFDGMNSSSYLGGQEIIYSVPVYLESDVQSDVDFVMVGTRSKEKMQAMIASKGFGGNSLSCIIDSTGEVVLSPTDLKPFFQLDSIFRNDSDQKVIDDIETMRNNMRIGKNGILQFTSPYQTELFLAYNALGINDWILLTIIPSDLISSGSGSYILRSFFILGFAAVGFLLLLVQVFHLFNISKRKLERAAYVDEITGGMNHAAFQLKYMEAASHMMSSTYSIIMLNVRGFKLINKKLGLNGGNDMLRYIYEVLERHIHTEENEFAARDEYDHFCLCIKGSDPSQIQERLHTMLADIRSFRNTTLPVYPISFRLGACIIDDPCEEVTILQDRARLAYQNKAGRTEDECIFYDESFVERIKKEQELDELFPESLANHDFQVYLQPKVCPETNEVEGAEALVRWLHPKKGIIYPSDFIPLFEKNGRICLLDLYMFEEVCALIQKRIHSGKKLIPISVNLSRQHFYKPDFLEKFSEIARSYQIPDDILEFELTESIFLDFAQIHVVKESILKMHELGFRCSLDDFGSGFSSLGLLKEFDVDALKLDRVFFLNMDSEKARDVIACLIELAKKLNLKTVAEGIETPKQAEYLRSMHCDMIQGYIYSKPLAVPEFEEWEENK